MLLLIYRVFICNSFCHMLGTHMFYALFLSWSYTFTQFSVGQLIMHFHAPHEISQLSCHLEEFPSKLKLSSSFCLEFKCLFGYRLFTFAFTLLRVSAIFFSFSTVPWLLTLVPNLMHTLVTCQHFNQLFSV